MKDQRLSEDCLETRSGTDAMTSETARVQVSVQDFGALLESLPDAMVVINRSGDIVRTNSQLEQLFGYGRGELIGQRLEVLLPARYHVRHRRSVANFVDHPRFRPMGSGLELFGLKKDGTEFPVDISLSYATAGGELRQLRRSGISPSASRLNARTGSITRSRRRSTPS